MTGVLSDEVKTDLTGRIPLKRMGTAEDVAAAVRFLASEEAGYITGQCSTSTAECTCDHCGITVIPIVRFSFDPRKSGRSGRTLSAQLRDHSQPAVVHPPPSISE